MKKEILDIKEMSDSKEVYGQRPNPFISGFIYTLVSLFVVAVIYTCIGKIEIVATTSGIVRPNEDIGTVSSLTSGKVTEVNFSDGQIVEQGDTLFSVDTSEAQITLDSLMQSQNEAKEEAAMLQKFLDGIEAEKNPFSSDTNSKEYPYYIQYQKFALSLKDTELTSEYDGERTIANIQALQRQISTFNTQLSGLSQYKSSVEKGENLLAPYPNYESQYLLYRSKLYTLKSDYETQKRKIELDTSSESNNYHITYYQDQISRYKNLIASINAGTSQFPTGDTSSIKLLYDDYVYNLNEYERSYDRAKETYDFYRNGGNAGNSSSPLLNYNQTMLEGYNFYKQSVTSGEDKFNSSRDSFFYHNLYLDYKTEWDVLDTAAKDAERAYNDLLGNPAATEAEISEALSKKDSTFSERDTYKTTTLATINNTILQIEATIAESEITIGTPTIGYNLETAKLNMDSAKAAIDTYKNQKLGEYSQALAELETQLDDLKLTGASTQSKEELLSDLETTYTQSVDQQYHTTVTQIDNSIQSLQSELSSAQSNLRLNQIANSLYQKNRDENGNPVAISTASVEQISTLLNGYDTAIAQADELEYQIQQTKEQIEQGCISAGQAGILNVSSPLVNGDVITAGTQVATIIPLNESEFRVQLYVNNADIANIEEGDTIKYNIAALPSNQYGTINGVVTKIAKDTLVQDGQYSGYFVVEGTIDNADLLDKDGNMAEISIGMQLEAKIVTQEKTIMRYLLEKINLW